MCDAVGDSDGETEGVVLDDMDGDDELVGEGDADPVAVGVAVGVGVAVAEGVTPPPTRSTARIRLFARSATTSVVGARKAMPLGPPHVDAVPAPSARPLTPHWPAIVETLPVATATARMVYEPWSLT